MSRPQPAPRLGKTVRRLLVLLVLAAIVVAALPTIVAKTDLRNRLLSMAVPSDVATVYCRGATLGWLTPLALREVEVRDATGQTILTAAAIRLDRSVWDLLQSSQQLGTIQLESPLVYVRIRSDGSNVEDVVGALAGPEETDQAEPPSLSGFTGSTSYRLRIVDGAIVSEDVSSGRTYRTDGVNVELDSPDAGSNSLRVNASGRIAPGPPTGFGPQVASAVAGTGTFSLRLVPTGDGQQRLDLDVQSVPLAALAPWLRRYVSEPVLDGLLTAQGSALWSPAAASLSGGMLPPGFRSAGQLVIDNFHFSVPQLAGDHVRLARIEAPWDLVGEGQTLIVNNMAIHSPLGHVAGRGALDVLSLTSEAATATFERHELEVRGGLDLARLATMLPHALRVREGTTITGGDVDLLVHSRPIAGGARLSGSVEAARLTATNSGRALRWEAPIRALFDASREQGRWRVDAVECQSDFCEITASGDLRGLEANAQFDLDRLAEQLGQFIDLSQWQPSGRGTARLTCTTTPDKRFVADGEFQLREFVLASGARNVWSEPKLTVVARSAGTVDPQSNWPRLVDSAVLQLRAEGDSLDASLLQAVDIAAPAASWPVTIRATGDLGRWLARTQPVLSLDDWQVAGDLDLTANLRFNGDLVEIAGSKVRLTKVRGTAPGWRIDEPRVELSGDVLWDRATRRIASRDAQFVSSTASMAARDVQLAVPQEGAASATGTIAVRADLGRVGAMRIPTDGSPPWQTTGMLTCNLEFASRGEQVVGNLNLEANDLSLAEPKREAANVVYTTIWQEPRLVAHGGMTYSPTSDQLALEQFRITSQTLALVTSGAIDQLSAERRVNFAGTVDYDLVQMGQLLKPYVGESVQLAGREQARFQLGGALADTEKPSGVTTRLTAANSTSSAHWSHTLQGKLEAPWQGASVFGLPVGPGQVVARLGEGGVGFEPLSFAVGKGRLDATPYVRLDPEPQELTLARGQVLTDVYISREVSDAMLKYIAPVLADATRSAGTFSLRVDGGRVPLEDPKQAEVAGQLRLQSVEVLPGPSTEQWVSLAQRVENLIKNRDPQALVGQPPKTLLRITDRTIPYRVAGGRVYHEEMEFYVGEVVVQSRGSVGFDQTLDMTLRVPILDKWVDNSSALAGMRGKSVEIPVGGTLARPRVDAGAITAISGQLLRDAAQGAIGGEINKALNKLFGR